MHRTRMEMGMGMGMVWGKCCVVGRRERTWRCYYFDAELVWRHDRVLIITCEISISCQVADPDVPEAGLSRGEGQVAQTGKEEEAKGEEGGEDGAKGRCEFVIDGGVKGNVARFFNHSCDPNMFMQNTLWEHGDVRFAHPVLVASENIVAMTVSGSGKAHETIVWGTQCVMFGSCVGCKKACVIILCVFGLFRN